MDILYIIAAIGLVLWVLSAIHKAKVRGARESGILPPPGHGSDADVRRLVGLGEKILAIKLYREIHGVELKQAKDAVDRMIKQTPMQRP
jgi:ribosomal protein L7/L12